MSKRLTTIRISIYTNHIRIVLRGQKMEKNLQENNNNTSSTSATPLGERDLQNSVVEIKFLATSWLDEFEKKIFEGKTVKQIINPRKYE